MHFPIILHNIIMQLLGAMQCRVLAYLISLRTIDFALYNTARRQRYILENSARNVPSF